MKVWRCRWCGRRVHGVFGWFHKPAKCDQRLSVKGPTPDDVVELWKELHPDSDRHGQ